MIILFKLKAFLKSMQPPITPAANVSALDVISEFLFVVGDNTASDSRLSVYRRSATVECWVRFTEFAHSVFCCFGFLWNIP